jgi:hypothetical protein
VVPDYSDDVDGWGVSDDPDGLDGWSMMTLVRWISGT